ncbi:MAG: hypothetical protein J7497_15785 [Chitinophagaceae bacterium]|nr:hypothetical protein [Chitinophagaceae bacterium]
MLIHFRKKTKRKSVSLFNTDLTNLRQLGNLAHAGYNFAGTNYPVIYLWNPDSLKLFCINVVSGGHAEIPIQSWLPLLTKESNVTVHSNEIHIVGPKSTCTIEYNNGQMGAVNFKFSSSENTRKKTSRRPLVKGSEFLLLLASLQYF